MDERDGTAMKTAERLSQLVGLPRRVAAAGLLCFTLAAGAAPAELDWEALRNPILGDHDQSLHDFCVVEADGLFHIFCSAFQESGDAPNCTIVQYTSADLVRFAEVNRLDGASRGWRGTASPYVVHDGNRYVLVGNSWGDAPEQPNALFWCESPDLMAWSSPRPLAANLTGEARAVDPALAPFGEVHLLIWNQGRLPRVAHGERLVGDFAWLGPGYLELSTVDGAHRPYFASFQVLRIGEGWRLLAAAREDRHRPYLFERPESTSAGLRFSRWENGTALDIPVQDFNREILANGAWLLDRRATDGWFYLFYAGSNGQRRADFGGRGWNRLGIARSRELARWEPAGMAGAAVE